jgi:hypothetical protein
MLWLKPFYEALAALSSPLRDLTKRRPAGHKPAGFVPTYPVKMLQHGYNGSEVPPLNYEASALSTTIALHCEVTPP